MGGQQAILFISFYAIFSLINKVLPDVGGGKEYRCSNRHFASNQAEER
jgi:hypothetical protein